MCPLPLCAWDGLRYVIVALPEMSIYLFFECFDYCPLMFHETLINEQRHEKTNNMVYDLVDTNQAVQLQKMARGLKFWI